jgi:hypothetical protein
MLRSSSSIHLTWGVVLAVLIIGGTAAVRADVIEIEVSNNVFTPN